MLGWPETRATTEIVSEPNWRYPEQELGAGRDIRMSQDAPNDLHTHIQFNPGFNVIVGMIAPTSDSGGKRLRNPGM